MGMRFVRNSQNDENTCSIPVIFLSVKGTIDEKKDAKTEGLKEINEAFNRGASDFLNKPVTARELIEAIKKALSFTRILGV
jgi:FixJ family two-component response regulator